MSTPFIIYSLPRCRTAWLAEFLSYKDWKCWHEQALCMRNMEDVKVFFSAPNIGTVETAAFYGRHLIKHYIPNIKEIVILRPVDESVEAMMKCDTGGLATYDYNSLKKIFERGNRELQKMAEDKNVLAIDYSNLTKRETCVAIFEYCLPYAFDDAWWETLRRQNIQVNVESVLRYYYQNKDIVESFKRLCKSELRKLCRFGMIEARA